MAETEPGRWRWVIEARTKVLGEPAIGPETKPSLHALKRSTTGSSGPVARRAGLRTGTGFAGYLGVLVPARWHKLRLGLSVSPTLGPLPLGALTKVSPGGTIVQLSRMSRLLLQGPVVAVFAF